MLVQVPLLPKKIHNLKTSIEMYFVAFFRCIKEHRVVPYTWVKGTNYEGMINDGLNRNKQFKAFYTNDPNAFDQHGVPRIDYPPDPNAPDAIFPNGGWYICQLRRFKGIQIRNYL